MELLIGSFVVLFLFFTRDVFLLGSTRDHIWCKMGLYCGLTLTCLLTAVWIWHSLRPEAVAQLLQSRVLWFSILLTHAALWFVARWFKRRPVLGNRMWIMAVPPAPMLVLAVLAFSQRLTMIFGTADRLRVASVMSGVWVAAVLIGVLIFHKAQGDGEDFDFATALAEMASWTGIGILPFTGVLELAEVFFQ